MATESLFKRVVIDLGVVVAAVLLILGSVAGYMWFKEPQRGEESRKRAEALLADATAQKNGLNALGQVDFDPAHMTLADLQKKMHQPGMRQAGAQDSTMLGWACGTQRCAIRASFLVPVDKEIPTDMIPAAFMVTSASQGDFHKVALGGVHLGDKVETLKEICQKRGYGQEIGHNRVRWGKDWNLVWGEVGGKVFFLTFQNEKLLKSAGAKGDGKHPDVVNIRKGDAK